LFVPGGEQSKFLTVLPADPDTGVAPRLYSHPRQRPEPDALVQLADAAALPGVRGVVGMPDIHVGYGVPIGCVMAADGIVCPAAVGYDINCGMRLLAAPPELRSADIDAPALAKAIARRVPLGEGKDNFKLDAKKFKRLIAGGVPALDEIEIPGLADAVSHADRFGGETERIEDGGKLAADPDFCSEFALDRGRTQIGTLGGGNHFIEIQYVEIVYDGNLADAWGLREGGLCVMIHSGSRGLGHQVGDDYMALGRVLAAKDGRKSVGRELPYFRLDEPEAREYISAMNAAANFAFINRQVIALLVREALWEIYPGVRLRFVYDFAHNIAKFEGHGCERLLIHRKGAARAFTAARMKDGVFAATGQPVLVPGSMGTASYVMAGCDEGGAAYASVNHGAGRRLSRAAARGKSRSGRTAREEAVTDAEFAAAMRGIHLIAADMRFAKEEAPQAYKDIDLVTEAVVGAGLAEKVARLKPLAVLKG
jgi:tRNA-splicing ligase RtcB